MPELLGLDVHALDRARISRDPRFDGKFFIAVTSTGIYCRPVCPVRSPKRTNIRYYATAAAAAEAGYRPCLRCRPEAAPGTPAWMGTSAVVRRAMRLIDEGFLDQNSVDQLSLRVGIGPRHLHRLFVQHVGASPVVVAQTRRLHFAKRLLDETSLPITEIALAAGFGSLRRFNSAFHSTYQRTPRDLRKRHPKGLASQDRDEVVLKLTYRPPYDWLQVRDFLATRAAPGVERVDERGYARTVVVDGRPGFICVRALEGEHALELRVRGVPPEALFQLASSVRRVFDLAADPTRIGRALQSDPLLAPLVKRHPGLRIPGAWNLFECGVRAILGQQVSVAAARTLAGRLVAQLGKAVPDADLAGANDYLTHLFPSASDVAAASLENLGLTRARANALRSFAQAVADKTFRSELSPDEVISALAALPGVGAWTAQYIALRALDEPDAFPSSDLILRRVASAGGPPLAAKALESLAEAWRPWRGYAAIHLWRSATDAARAAAL